MAGKHFMFQTKTVYIICTINKHVGALNQVFPNRYALFPMRK
jgi:hypothetical protein